MKQILLTKNQIAIVDDRDYESISQYKWYALKGKNSFYACRRCSQQNKNIYMHRLLMNVNDSKIKIDHINRNGLDNRKNNLRICTNSQNQGNRKKRKICSSKFKGVCWDKNRKKWIVYIKVNKNKIFLGRFDNEIKAAKAYDIAAKKHFGGFARMNLDNNKSSAVPDSYDEDYFQRGIETKRSLYTNYRWLPEETMQMAMAMIDHLGITKYHTVLDYGCSRGYLVKALQLLNRVAYGVDISEYAINNCDPVVVKCVGQIEPISDNVTVDHRLHMNSTTKTLQIPWPEVFDFIISKDTLEHVPYGDIETTIETIAKQCKTAFFVIPLGDHDKYRIHAYESDITHVIREDENWWELLLTKYFHIQHTLHQVEGIKDKWYEIHKKGNGFFTLISRHNNV